MAAPPSNNHNMRTLHQNPATSDMKSETTPTTSEPPRWQNAATTHPTITTMHRKVVWTFELHHRAREIHRSAPFHQHQSNHHARPRRRPPLELQQASIHHVWSDNHKHFHDSHHCTSSQPKEGETMEKETLVWWEKALCHVSASYRAVNRSTGQSSSQL